MKNVKSIAVLASALALSACAGMIGDSAMRPPNAPPSEMDQVLITGLGFYRTGTFELAGGQGSFKRSSDRWNLFGYGSNTGDTDYIVSGGEFRGELVAHCHHGQGDLALADGVKATVRRLSFRCEFERDGFPLPASLEVKERGTLRNARGGAMIFNDRRLQIRSVHHMKGTSLPTETPVGYVFLEGGREIGGVDLNDWKTKRVYLPRDPDLRQAALAASLALALFWDPQNTVDD